MARKRNTGIGRGFSRVLLTLLLIGVLCASFCGIAFAYYVHAYVNPSVELDLDSMFLDLNTTVWSIDPATGEEKLYETLQGDKNREWVDGDQIPDNLKNAVVAIEDQRFYQHKGVDWKRTLGASVSWMTGGKTYGGSTITQQLIKNMTDEDDFSVKRKITEIFRALELERAIGDKDEIIVRYLNTIYLGRRAYGVKTAAATYFGKQVSDLSLAECAILAGITNNPSEYDPYTYPDNIKERQETILDQMLKQGMISQEEHDQAVAEELNYRSEDLYEDEINDPYSYFTDLVYNDVLSDLQTKKGYSSEAAKRLLLSGGLKIYATVDTDVQKIMDEEYANDANFPNMERGGMRPQSAMVVTDAQGNIRGIVGGRGAKSGKLDYSRATDARRQPGSSIKPLSAYGPAMDTGIIVPTSSVYDKALMEIDGNPWPRNDSGKTTNKPIVIKNAIARSINTIAAQLVNMLTPQVSYEYLTQRLGFRAGNDALVSSRTNGDGTVQTDIDYGPLALGGMTNGVTVREMAGAYSTFINDGVFAGTRSYSKVLDSNGEVLLDNQPGTELGFKNVRTAYYMLECMQGVTSFGTATNATIPGVQTAGKTGTTSANYDLWFCGVTPKYAAAVWLGFDQNYTLSGLYGRDAATVWTKIMRRIHEGDSGLVFDSHPEDFETASYCMDSGLAPSGACRAAGRVATGRFWKGQAPTELCKHQGYPTYLLGKDGLDVENEDEEEKPKEEKPDDSSTVDPETGEAVTPPAGGGTTTPGGNTGTTTPGDDKPTKPDTGGQPTTPGTDEPTLPDDPEA